MKSNNTLTVGAIKAANAFLNTKIKAEDQIAALNLIINILTKAK